MSTIPKRFIFHSEVAFEKWNWENSIKTGIGGSETSHVELSWRLAKKGWEVITYAPLPDDSPNEWRGTKWYPIEQTDYSLEGHWLIYRKPDLIDKFQANPNQKFYLIYQDYDYPGLTKERNKKFDRHVTLCQAHGNDILRRHPDIGDKLWLTSNGLKVDLIEEIEKEGIPERNPYKVIFTSSPDRGLKYVIQSVLRAREFEPKLELHAFYGFNNLSKLKWAEKQITELEKLLKSPGIIWRGRVSQKELYKEWMSAGIWCYQTNFLETSCITCMEAQACGAIPLFNPIYALAENVQYGIPIYGDAYQDPLTRSRYVGELVRLATRHDLQEAIRKPMMEWARKRFDWEVFVRQWELEAEDKREEFEKEYEFPVQIERKKACQ